MQRTNAHKFLWRDMKEPSRVREEIDRVVHLALTECKPWLYHEYDDTIYYLKLKLLELELGISVDETILCEKHSDEQVLDMDKGS